MTQPASVSSLSVDDQQWMLQALQLAERGLGSVEPNPMVGCVLVSQGEVVGKGYHQRFGGPHAERVAVDSARQAGWAHRLPGCTAYVTLEPCCHQGKTPPCSDLLIEIGTQRAVIAMQDPFPAVAGGGIRQLQSANIQVDVGLCDEAARQLNAAYIKRILTGRPWIIAKWAMSLDGRIATRTGHSQWISCPDSRDVVHRLRSRVDAILVGSGTALADNPLLTPRLPPGEDVCRRAVRVVADSKLAISPDSRLATTADQYPTLIWTTAHADPDRVKALRDRGCRVEICGLDDPSERLDQLLQFLVVEYAATNVLVEGGQALLGCLMDLGQIDECHTFIAPKMIGGRAALSPIGGIGRAKVSDGPRCYAVRMETCGQDVHLSCRLDWTGCIPGTMD